MTEGAWLRVTDGDPMTFWLCDSFGNEWNAGTEDEDVAHCPRCPHVVPYGDTVTASQLVAMMDAHTQAEHPPSVKDVV
jgi:hypothetical protein